MDNKFEELKQLLVKELKGANFTDSDFSSYVIKEIDYSIEDIEEVKKDVLKDADTYKKDSKKSKILSKILGLISNEEYFLECLKIRLDEASICDDYKLLLLDLLKEFTLKSEKSFNTYINILTLNRLIMNNFFDNADDLDKRVVSIIHETKGYSFSDYSDEYYEKDVVKRFFYKKINSI